MLSNLNVNISNKLLLDKSNSLISLIVLFYNSKNKFINKIKLDNYYPNYLIYEIFILLLPNFSSKEVRLIQN